MTHQPPRGAKNQASSGNVPVKIARRKFLKTAGAGVLAGAAFSTPLRAEPKAKAASGSRKRRASWAYTGTDNDPGVMQYPLTPNNSLPALVVWLTMAVSTDLQNNMPENELQRLADAVGLTKNSVAGIRNLMTTGTATVNGNMVNVADAFTAVAQVFLQIGIPRGSGPYNPSACPGLVDILSFGPAAAARIPKPN